MERLDDAMLLWMATCSHQLCTRDVLIVAGGMGEGGALSTVEVMNTKNHWWFTAADLPQPIYRASATVCRDIVSLHAGRS